MLLGLRSEITLPQTSGTIIKNTNKSYIAQALELSIEFSSGPSALDGFAVFIA